MRETTYTQIVNKLTNELKDDNKNQELIDIKDFIERCIVEIRNLEALNIKSIVVDEFITMQKKIAEAEMSKDQDEISEIYLKLEEPITNTLAKLKDFLDGVKKNVSKEIKLLKKMRLELQKYQVNKTVFNMDLKNAFEIEDTLQEISNTIEESATSLEDKISIIDLKIKL